MPPRSFSELQARVETTGGEMGADVDRAWQADEIARLRGLSDDALPGFRPLVDSDLPPDE